MIFRQATIKEFLSLWKGPEFAGKQFHYYIENDISEFWIIQDTEKITGKLYLFKKLNDTDIADGNSIAYITNFFVLPEYRGQGLGTKLLKRTFERLKELGFSYASVGVNESEESNMRLYKKLGFTQLIRKCSYDVICLDENENQISTEEYLLIKKELT